MSSIIETFRREVKERQFSSDSNKRPNNSFYNLEKQTIGNDHLFTV
jgi:hypothetical protein